MIKRNLAADENYSMYHIEISRKMAEGAAVALLPGSPERAALIAQSLDKPKLLARHRGLEGWLGYLDGTPVISQSTGMGGPSLEIVVQELMKLGVNAFLRVGTTGSIQSDVAIGTIIITEAAVRLDGTSDHYAPKEFPAAADVELTHSLISAAKASGAPYASGLTVSSASFYAGQERYDNATGYVQRAFQGSLAEWQKLGVLNYEMEAAALYTIARASGAKAGCLCGAIANRTKSEEPNRALIAEIEKKAINVALEGLKIYIKNVGL